MIRRIQLLPIALVAISGIALVSFGYEEVAVSANGKYSTAELALEEHWIKGAAPILAANFDEVKITHVNKDVEESFVFDVALGQIYGIEADYTLPPLDVRSLKVSESDLFLASEKERSEVFCNNKDLKYCELVLAWTAPADSGEFVGLRIDDARYALVEVGLARELGVKID